MRGKAFFVTPLYFCIGITPAYAGKSLNQKQTAEKEKDHPRLCGEKLHTAPSQRPAYRITPAYAGKSDRQSRFGYGDQDHPRLCGEKAVQGCRRRSRLGSPPPMRGKD